MMKFNIDDFGPYKLSSGSHESPKDGMCVMEMVSFLEGEEWSDRPTCTSPVIASFCRIINDRMPQEYRDRLQKRVLRLVDTVDPNLDQQRAEFLAWQAIKVYAPIALSACGFDNRARELRDFDENLGLTAASAFTAASVSASDVSAYAAAHSDAYAAAHSDAYAAAYAAAHSDAFTAAAYSAASAAASAAAYAVAYAAAYAEDFQVWDLVLRSLDQLLDIGSRDGVENILSEGQVDRLRDLDLVLA